MNTNIYCSKSVGRGVELKNPVLKYENYDTFFSNKYLPLNYCQFAENIHNLENEEYNDELPFINIISLKKDIERREVLESILDKTDYPNFRFVEGIKNKIGWVGCGLSHLNIIKNAYDNNDEFVIIAEDDILPLFPKIKNSILKAIKILKENENLDTFNSYPYGEWNNNIKKRIGLNAYEVSGGILNHFVIHHKRSFKKLLKLLDYYKFVNDDRNKQFLAIDEFINKHLNQFTLYPFMFYQFGNYSNTEGNNKNNLMSPENMFLNSLSWNSILFQKRKFEFNENSDVCVVCFSCGRFNEMITMIKSFYSTNTYDINNFIVIDDSNNKKMLEINEYFPEINVIQKYGKGGHLNNIKLGYKLARGLESKYIFHLEEDWKFINSYYIEQSIKILEKDENVINVWLRDLNDTNLHPLNCFKNIDNMNCYKLETNYTWKGFTFNPSLKRLENFKEEIFENIVETENCHFGVEKQLDELLFDYGFYSVILPFGSVYHTGYITSIPQWLNINE